LLIIVTVHPKSGRLHSAPNSPHLCYEYPPQASINQSRGTYISPRVDATNAGECKCKCKCIRHLNVTMSSWRVVMHPVNVGHALVLVFFHPRGDYEVQIDAVLRLKFSPNSAT